MRDELPLKANKNESAIYNIDSSENSGSHWTCWSKRGNLVKYFDSFGNVPPPLEFVNYVGPKAEIIYNRNRYQDFDSSNCGQLCLKFLKSIKD